MNKKVVLLAFICALATWALFRFYLAPSLFLPVTSSSDTYNKELRLYSFAEYFPESIISKFEEKYGYKVRYDNYSNNEELLAKLQAGAQGYDVIVPSDYMVQALIENQLIQKLDHKKIPNIKNIYEYFQYPPYDKGLEYTIPYTWGTTGFIYNTKHVKEDITSLSFLKSGIYSSKISLLDDQREALGMLMRELGFSANSIDPTEIKQALSKLKEIKPKIRIFTSDPKQHILSEDIWIAQIYSGDALQLTQEDQKLRYVVPKEGATVWVDNFAIPVGAHNKEAAYAFINFVLEPETALEITEELVYASPNKSIQNQLKKDDLKPNYIRKISKGKLEFLKDLGIDSQVWDDAWSQVKSF